MIEGPV